MNIQNEPVILRFFLLSGNTRCKKVSSKKVRKTGITSCKKWGNQNHGCKKAGKPRTASPLVILVTVYQFLFVAAPFVPCGQYYDSACILFCHRLYFPVAGTSLLTPTENTIAGSPFIPGFTCNSGSVPAHLCSCLLPPAAAGNNSASALQMCERAPVRLLCRFSVCYI